MAHDSRAILTGMEGRAPVYTLEEYEKVEVWTKGRFESSQGGREQQLGHHGRPI